MPRVLSHLKSDATGVEIERAPRYFLLSCRGRDHRPPVEGEGREGVLAVGLRGAQAHKHIELPLGTSIVAAHNLHRLRPGGQRGDFIFEKLEISHPSEEAGKPNAFHNTMAHMGNLKDRIDISGRVQIIEYELLDR